MPPTVVTEVLSSTKGCASVDDLPSLNKPPFNRSRATSFSEEDLAASLHPKSRPRSVNELRDSSLFFDSLGSSDARLSILFASPETLPRQRGKPLTTPPNSSNRLSRSLTESDATMEAYRQNARKTNDPKVQLEFGKFLLESAHNLLNKESFTYDVSGAAKLEKEGLFWIRRLQKLNHPEAVYIVGTWHEKGLYGYSPNDARANSLFLSAAKLGFAPAIDKVAFGYERRKDYTRAVAYYRKAAALADPSANYRLGVAYIYGELKLVANYNYAQFYLRRSAAEATAYCPQGAYIWALVLFGLYEVDLGIRDEVEGREYLIKAADLNYLPAQYKLGYCYEFGEFGFTVDPKLSIEYYKRAAHAGHLESQVSLSGWYLTGAPGILEQSDSLAFSWCAKASERGLGKAEYAMGQYHEMGVGVDPDLDMALAWYKKASDHGFQKAKERLAQPDVAPTLTRTQFGSLRQPSHAKGKKKSDCVIS
ncbi:hypothetical protein L0F63_006346 [Massospora cicadina]|nr:hypothetical protein L0F63_006346 [Massospora cicadina]